MKEQLYSVCALYDTHWLLRFFFSIFFTATGSATYCPSTHGLSLLFKSSSTVDPYESLPDVSRPLDPLAPRMRSFRVRMRSSIGAVASPVRMRRFRFRPPSLSLSLPPSHSDPLGLYSYCVEAFRYGFAHFTLITFSVQYFYVCCHCTPHIGRQCHGWVLIVR